MTDETRLNRYLASAGIASRRKADALIAGGRVAIDGRVVREAGTRVAPGATVTLDGRPVRPEAVVHLLLHKPAGVVTTLSDPQGRPTVRDLVDAGERVYPVGRLDAATTGLLILTNDGDLAQHLAHPRHGVEKTYRVTVGGVLGDRQLNRLRAGVQLEDGPTWPARVEVVDAGPRRTVIDLTIHEGRNRQVRRMMEAVGARTRALERIRYGPLTLGDLPVGRSRALTGAEVEALRAAAT